MRSFEQSPGFRRFDEEPETPSYVAEPVAAPVAPAAPPGRAPRGPSGNSGMTPEIARAIAFGAEQFGVDEAVLVGMGAIESRNYDPAVISGKVLSPRGAAGMMQFMPETAKRFGIDPTDVAQSAIGAAAYMRAHLDMFGGDYDKAMAAYNWGEGNVQEAVKKWGDKWLDHAPEQTQNYIAYVNQMRGQATPQDPAKLELPEGVKPSEAGGGRGMMVEEPGARAASLETVSSDKSLINAQLDQPFTPISGTRAGLRGAAKPTPKSVMEGVGQDPVNQIERRGAPVTAETAQAARQALANATPAERALAASQPGWIGAVARAQNSQLAADDRSPEQIRRGIGTRQAREELYRSEGLDPQAAQERVTSDIAAGRAAAPLPSANLTQEQDRAVRTAIETGQEMRGSGFASRVGARTGLALGKGALGVVQFVADVTGQDDVSSNISKSRTVLDARENAIPDAGGVVGQAEKALSSVLMQLPHIALGAAGGGLAPILAQAAIQQFGDSYTEGKKRGLGVTESATRAGLMAAAEVVFERFGMGEKFQAFRNIANGSKNPIEKTFALYLDSQKKEIPAEMATTLSQFMVDKAPGIGTNQRAGTEELLSQLGDTIAQTMLGGGATFGAAHAAGAAVRAIVPDQPPAPQSLFSKDSLRADFENMAKRRGETFGSDATREAGLPDLVVPKGPAPTQVEDKPTVSARLPKMPGQEEADPAQRQAELERKAKGTEDKQVPGLDGKIITVPGEQGQYLTDAERTELAGLKAQGASPAAPMSNPQPPVADATGVDLASQAPLPSAPNVEPRGVEPSVTTPAGGVTDIVGRQTVQTGPALTTTSAPEAPAAAPGKSLTGISQTDKTPKTPKTPAPAALLRETPVPGVSQPPVRTELPEVEPAPNARPALLDGSYTGDVLAAPEQPFASKSQANLFRDKNQLKGWEAAPIANGWVLRPTSLEPTIGELRHGGQAVAKLQSLQIRGAAPFAGVTLADALPADTGRAFGVARVAARSLGINLVPVNGLASDGLYVDNQADSVFVAADSEKPILFVAGHEVYHALKRLGGSVVRDFEQAVSAYLKPEVVADRQAEEEAGALPGQQMQGRGREEVVADVTGAMWLDPKFWREVMLRSPDLFQKVSAAFMEAATKIRAALTRNPSPEAKQFVNDVDAVRKLVAQMTVDARKGAPVKAGDSRKVDSDKNGAIATPSQSENANSRNGSGANPGQPQNAPADKNGATAAPTQAAEDVAGDLTEDEQAIAQAELEASMADGQWPGPDATGEIGPNGEVYFSGRKIDPIPTKIQLSKDELALSDLEILYGKGASGEKKSVREAAQLLQDRAIAALEKLGVAPGDLTDPKLQALASKIIAAEIEVALRKPGNAADWYSNKLVGTMAVASLIHPELRSDAKSRVAFLIALAVTSQNMAVPDNLSHSEGQYAAWKSTGEFPIRGWGTGAKAMRTNFARANALMKEYPAERLERFLNSTFTVGELSAVGWEVSGENVDTIVYGSAVFGPKIGNGFYQNISGNFTPLTMDMWFMRGIGRITGNLISGSQEEFGRLKEKFLGTATDIDFSGLEPSADFAEEHGIDEFTEENIKDDDVATELAKRVDSWFSKEFKKYRDQYDSGERTKPAIVNAAQRLIEQGGTNDVPVSGAHRNNLRKIFSGALKLLEDSGVPLTNADGQAIWWFPEKELYARLGAGNKKSAPTDYEREMIGIAKKRGFTDEQIKAEIGRARQRKRRSDKAGANGQGPGPIGGPSKQLTAAERSEFLRQRALDAYRGSAAAYGRGAGDGKSVRLLVGGKKVPVVSVFKVNQKAGNRLNAVGIATPPVYEIGPQSAGLFHGAISALKNNNPWAAAVHVYEEGEYAQMRLFLTQDGKAGFALKGDDVVSVFSAQKDGAAHSMLALAVQEGGRRLDAFDTVLPKIYALNGFVATSRTAWNEEYAPSGWSKVQFANFNRGQPDVVYMAYSPARSQLHTPESGKLMDYDAALAAQQAAVDNGGTNATQEPTILRSARASGPAEPPLRSGGGGGAGARSGDQNARGWSKRTPQPGSVTVAGWHFGKTKVPALSGTMYGSGIKGEEADRLAQSRDRRIKSRVYFYINRDDGTPPPKEGGLGPHKYEQSLANLYDPSTGDPRIPLIREGMNEFESAILDAGYDGYIVPRFGMAVVMDATVPAKYVGEDKVGPAQITTPVSQRAKKSLMSREIFEVEPLVPQLQKVDPTLKFESGRVTYDPAAKDALNAEMARAGTGIRFSRRPKPPPGGFSIPAPAGRFTLDPESEYMRNRRVVQDRFIRLREVQKMIAEQGGLLNDDTDAYRAEERSHGRVAFAIDEFKDKWMRPFTEKAAKVGIDLDELSLYAYAKHAEERNRHIASINPSLPDGGSGMTTADAQAIIARFQAQPNFQDIRDLHNDLMAVTQASRDLLWNEGLISDDEYTAWNNQYNDYIPLRGFEGVDPETGVRTGGRGINVRGGESMRALGRRSRAGNLIENVIADYERAVLRAEKNEIGRTFYRFVQANPDSKLWEVDPVKRTRKYDPTKHLVVSSLVEDVGPDTIAFKEDGKEVHIKIHDEALLRTMRASYMDETGQFQRVAAETLGVFNGYLRNTLTRWNPGFVVINTARDFQTANASVVDKLGFGALAKYNLHVASAAAVAWRNERGTLVPGGGWDKWMTEFRAAGGATGGFFGRDVERIASDLRGMLIDAGATVQPKGSTATAKAIDRAVIALRGNRAAKVAAATAKLVESMGGMSENMFRVAAYRTAREMGKSPAQAASIAKNLTTNFDRRGEVGLFLNSAYLFFNASLQGAVRTLQYAKNPKMAAVAAAGVALGLTAAMLGADAGEEDGESYWDMIPDYIKERNLVIMLPPSEDKTLTGERIGKKGRYIKIPLAYGLNFLPVLGYGLADSFRHAQDPSKGRKSLTSAARVANAFLGSYNPLGGGVPKSVDEAWLMALPTVADIPYTLTQEIDSFGRKAAPEKTRKEEPDSERAFMSDRGTAQHRVARWLNQATGGNKAQSGAIDITPATIEGAVRYATGGTGTFIMDVLSTAGQALGEEKVKSQNVPFLKALYGEVDSKAIIRDFYENRDEIEKSYAQLMAATKMGVPIPKSKQNDALYELGGYLQGIQKGLTELRKWEVDAVSREMSEDPEARKSGKADRERVEAEKAKLMRAFNKHHRKTWGAAE